MQLAIHLTLDAFCHPCLSSQTLWNNIILLHVLWNVVISQSTTTLSSLLTSPEGWLQLDVEMRNMTRDEGSIIRIRCEITGSPLPHYRWYKDNVPIENLEYDENHLNVRPTPWGSRLKLGPLAYSDSGIYTCEASNKYGVISTSGYLTIQQGSSDDNGKSMNKEVDETKVIDEFDIEDGIEFSDETNNWLGIISDESELSKQNGFCQPYRGAACSQYINMKNIFVTSNLQQSITEERLTAALTVLAQSKELSEECSQFVIPALCLSAFPLCDERALDPRPRFLCNDECQKLENGQCKTEYVLMKNLGSNFLLPKCSEKKHFLPKSGNCVRLLVDNGVKTVSISPAANNKLGNFLLHHCYNGTGEEYKGTIATTISGYKCQKWTEDLPHMHSFRPADYQELGDHNFCRNPGGKESAPWCFTMNTAVRVEMCAIPKCSTTQRRDLLTIGLPCIAVTIAFLIILLFIYLHRRSKKVTLNKCSVVSTPCGKQTTSLTKKQLQDLNTTPLLVQTKITRNSLQHSLPVIDVFPSSIRFIEEIGTGAFGRCFQGEISINNQVTKVHIKTLHNEFSQKMHEDFISNAENVITAGKHQYVANLIAICLQNSPICIVYEHLSLSDNLRDFLRQYLTNESAKKNNYVKKSSLHTSHLFDIAFQIATGMDHLSSYGIIHRDLSACNVIVMNKTNVQQQIHIKIVDVGLWGNKKIQNDATKRVRWLAPEVLYFAQYSNASDVWSYGIVLWEIYSLGQEPYNGHTNEQVIFMVQNRHILRCPEVCDQAIYSMMVECWHEAPSRRPSFLQLLNQFKQWQKFAAMNESNYNCNLFNGKITDEINVSNIAHTNRLDLISNGLPRSLYSDNNMFSLYGQIPGISCVSQTNNNKKTSQQIDNLSDLYANSGHYYNSIASDPNSTKLLSSANNISSYMYAQTNLPLCETDNSSKPYYKMPTPSGSIVSHSSLTSGERGNIAQINNTHIEFFTNINNLKSSSNSDRFSNV